MNQLQKVFNYEGQNVRTIVKNNEPWFVAKDICEILGLSNPTESLRALDLDEKSTLRISEGGPEVNIINEPGLYSLVIRSNKPEARQFKRWITHEVIPQIRQTGGYIPANEDDDEQTILAKALLIANKTIENKSKLIAEQQYQLEQQKPLVMFAENCIASKDSLLVRETAKLASKNGLTIGEKKLYNWLREKGLILKCSTEPSQYAMDLGLFQIKKILKQTPYGTDTYETTMVTPKGQMYIIERLKREQKLEKVS